MTPTEKNDWFGWAYAAIVVKVIADAIDDYKHNNRGR